MPLWSPTALIGQSKRADTERQLTSEEIKFPLNFVIRLHQSRSYVLIWGEERAAILGVCALGLLLCTKVDSLHNETFLFYQDHWRDGIPTHWSPAKRERERKGWGDPAWGSGFLSLQHHLLVAREIPVMGAGGGESIWKWVRPSTYSSNIQEAVKNLLQASPCVQKKMQLRVRYRLAQTIGKIKLKPIKCFSTV